MQSVDFTTNPVDHEIPKDIAKERNILGSSCLQGTINNGNSNRTWYVSKKEFHKKKNC